jgi:hypothetical protein
VHVARMGDTRNAYTIRNIEQLIWKIFRFYFLSYFVGRRSDSTNSFHLANTSISKDLSKK